MNILNEKYSQKNNGAEFNTPECVEYIPCSVNTNMLPNL